jgi:hypothetical protein
MTMKLCCDDMNPFLLPMTPLPFNDHELLLRDTMMPLLPTTAGWQSAARPAAGHSRRLLRGRGHCSSRSPSAAATGRARHHRPCAAGLRPLGYTCLPGGVAGAAAHAGVWAGAERRLLREQAAAGVMLHAGVWECLRQARGGSS